jgi:hypothetical protein
VPSCSSWACYCPAAQLNASTGRPLFLPRGVASPARVTGAIRVPSMFTVGNGGGGWHYARVTQVAVTAARRERGWRAAADGDDWPASRSGRLNPGK